MILNRNMANVTTTEEEKFIDERDRKELISSLRDLADAQSAGIQQKLHEIIGEAVKEDYFLNRSFYIMMVQTNSRDELKTPENKFFVRRSCPSPGYNQHVYKYHHVSGSLEYLWCIPRKNNYYHIWNNRLKYLYNPATKRLATFVISMESGELLKWVKKENGELPDAIIKVNQPKIEA